MKKNVLIFHGGTYTAIQIYFCLKDCVNFYPIFASSVYNHGAFLCNDAIINLPYLNEPNFYEELNKCILDLNIEFIIPTHDTIAYELMKHKHEINAIIICSPLETAEICRYKSKTYEILNDYSFVPIVYKKDDDNIKFPVFVKNDMGQGGQDSFKINSQEELNKLLIDNEDKYVICEYLCGDEITIDCFTDRHNNLLFVNPRTRTRTLNGISAHSENIALTNDIYTIAKLISKRIRFRGFWFIQCKKNFKGEYKLLEISTRLAGTFGNSKNLDVNLPLLALYDFSNIDVSIIPNNYNIISDKTYIDRYKIDYKYERVYIDFDDTIVFNKTRYNTEIVRFLYQCLNNKIDIILITKHAYNIHETLDSILLDKRIFNKIIAVPENEFKCKYINNEKKSIFIDNSFVERKAVKENFDMPTFDTCNIECLIDWN